MASDRAHTATRMASDPPPPQPFDAKSTWRGLRAMHKTVKKLSDKVSIHNKVSTRPTGHLADVAMGFQRGLAQLSKSQDGAEVNGRITGSLHRDGRTFDYVAKTYAADRFREFRRCMGVDEVEYVASLGIRRSAKRPSVRAIGVQDASGRSPSFFFLSPDHRFVIKSASKQEVKLLLRVLDRYMDHFGAPAGPSTPKNTAVSLLPRFFGVYSVYVPHGMGVKKRYLLVMNNWFAAQKHIHRRFDLKGSTSNRTANSAEKQKGHRAVYKDNDFLSSSYSLPLSQDGHVIKGMIERDAQLLRQLGLIDYSLLVGVHHKSLDDGNTARIKTNMDVFSVETDAHTFYIGIVDILTEYTAIKRLENLTGKLTSRDISCQPPHLYAERFVNFLDSLEGRECGEGSSIGMTESMEPEDSISESETSSDSLSASETLDCSESTLS